MYQKLNWSRLDSRIVSSNHDIETQRIDLHTLSLNKIQHRSTWHSPGKILVFCVQGFEAVPISRILRTRIFENGFWRVRKTQGFHYTHWDVCLTRHILHCFFIHMLPCLPFLQDDRNPFLLYVSESEMKHFWLKRGTGDTIRFLLIRSRCKRGIKTCATYNAVSILVIIIGPFSCWSTLLPLPAIAGKLLPWRRQHENAWEQWQFT